MQTSSAIKAADIIIKMVACIMNRLADGVISSVEHYSQPEIIIIYTYTVPYMSVLVCRLAGRQFI